jgi:hypothetical protein
MNRAQNLPFVVWDGYFELIAFMFPKSTNRVNWLRICLFVGKFFKKKMNFEKSEFQESIFRYLVVLWKMNWKTISSVWLCYGK